MRFRKLVAVGGGLTVVALLIAVHLDMSRRDVDPSMLYGGANDVEMGKESAEQEAVTMARDDWANIQAMRGTKETSNPLMEKMNRLVAKVHAFQEKEKAWYKKIDSPPVVTLAVTNGMPGLPGKRGFRGAEGLQGDMGKKGDTGDKGPEGPKGLEGPQGDQGPVGPTGIVLPLWHPNDLCALAPLVDAVNIRRTYVDINWAGDQGDKGPKGITGPQGPMGVRGPRGERGERGVTGEPGYDGAPGLRGQDGVQGLQGPKGTRFEPSPSRPPHGSGPVAVCIPKSCADAHSYLDLTPLVNKNRALTPASCLVRSPRGPPGRAGQPGLPGIAGIDGETGSVGDEGLPGGRGADGPKGAQGNEGPKGWSWNDLPTR